MTERGIALLLLFALGACARVTTTLPALDVAAIEAETVRLQRAAVAKALERTATLQRLAWPLLAANAELCPKTRPRLGLQLLDAKSLKGLTPGLTERHARALGYGDDAQVALVTPGGPADAAGIRPGDRIKTINGVVAPGGSAKLSAALGKAKPPLALTLVRADGSPMALQLAPQRVCAYPARLAALDLINASTNGKTLAINSGLLSAFGDDETLIQVVIGHELAHALLRHPQRAFQTSLLTGGAVVGTLAGAAGWTADRIAGVTGSSPPVSWQRRGLALATWPYGRDFEREADHVGLYLAARAGVDLARAETVFERFAMQRPANTWLALTHPITPERVVAIRATRAGIERKRAAGQPLIPDGLHVRTKE